MTSLDTPEQTRVRHHVTAVVVSHDGAGWLPASLEALRAQTRAPEVTVGVDTGSRDGSVALLAAALGSVVEVPRNHGFGRAVAAGLRTQTQTPDADVAWVWLLHDDSAPEPDCLERLLDEADLLISRGRSPGVLGPKQRGWHDRRLLLEVGFSVTGTGRRDTGLEIGERDQGQHDRGGEVLAVGSAGMLIRRDVWDDLRGFNPRLPLFRDDLDFCWRAHRAERPVRVVPSAVIHHREAATHGRRGPTRIHAAQRKATMHVLLAHAPLWRLPFTVIRLLLTSVLRALGWAIAKDLGAARDELAAIVRILLSPVGITRSRALVRRTTALPASCVRDLRPSGMAQIRFAVDAIGVRISSLFTSTAPDTAAATASALESGPTDDDADYLPRTSSRWLRRVIAHPLVPLVLALIVASTVAARGLWFTSGALLGGALLPAPGGAADLWNLYISGWHDIGSGSATAAPPYLAVVAALSTLLLGKAPLAIDILVLFATALAGFTAYLSLRGAITSTAVRAWAAIAYALLPAITGSIQTGRLGTIGAAVALPIAARFLVRTTGLASSRLPAPTPRTPWMAGLTLAIVVAFVPALWLVAVAAGLIALIVMRGLARRLGLLLALALPFALLLPWSLTIVRAPALLLLEPGLNGGATPSATTGPLGILLLDPGTAGFRFTIPGAGVVGIASVLLVIVGVLALTRRDTRPAALGAWVVALAGAALGLVEITSRVIPPTVGTDLVPWPGGATLVLGLALVVAAAVAGDGLTARVAGSNFGWRQPVALVLTIVAVLAPIAAAAAWLIGGVADPLRRGPVSELPAFVAADAEGSQRPRTLVLRPIGPGLIDYTLLNGAGMTLGDADVAPGAAQWQDLDAWVSALAAGRAGDEVPVLATYAVRFVQVVQGQVGPEGVIATLDSQPGLRRLSSAEGASLWRVDGVTSRFRFAPTGERVEGLVGVAGPGWTGEGPIVEWAKIDDRPGTLVVAMQADAGWRAVGPSGDLAVVPAPTGAGASWAQAFTAPTEAGIVRVWFDNEDRARWLWIQLGVLILAVILALPGRRATEADPDSDVAEVVEEPRRRPTSRRREVSS